MDIGLDDSQLFTALKTGGQDAYSIVYKRYVRQLCFFVESFTYNIHQAEDIAAESFIKTFQKVSEFQSLGGFKAYLFTVARNASLNYLKAEKSHKAANKQLTYLEDHFQESGEKALLQSEVISVVYEEIEKLPGQVREVIKLTVSQGKSLKEIADLLQISYKTVQNHKTRGINLLRVALLKNNMMTIGSLFMVINNTFFAFKE